MKKGRNSRFIIMLVFLLCAYPFFAFAESDSQQQETLGVSNNGESVTNTAILATKTWSAQVGKEYTVLLYSGNNRGETGQYQIKFNAAQLSLKDETIANLDSNPNLEALSVSTGSLGISVSRALSDGKMWKSAYALLRFKALATGNTTVSLESYSPPAGSWSGEGTAVSPYLIENEADLIELSEQVNAGTSYGGTYFRLVNNISLTDNWIPIGGRCAENSSYIPTGESFAGYFDGNNKTISNMVVNQVTGASSYGLFGFVSDGGIYNLNVSGSINLASTTLIEYIGGIAGYTTASIYNCHTNVAINVAKGSNVGGIVGAIENTNTEGEVKKVQYCSASGSISAQKRIGGISGGVYCPAQGGIRIDNCSYKTGTIQAASSGNNYAGGITGYCRGYISNCYVRDAGFVNTNGRYYGGIAGLMQGGSPQASMYKCYTKASFSNGTSINTHTVVGTADKSNTLPFISCYWQDVTSGITQPVSPNWGVWTNQAASTAAQMKNGTVAAALGNSFSAVTNDYPILSWEVVGYHTVTAGTETADTTPGGPYMSGN